MEKQGRIIHREELVKDIQAALGLETKAKAVEALESFEKILWDRIIVNNERVRLNGIGILRKEVRPAHTARVPNSDRYVEVPARFNVKLASASRPVE